MNCQWNSKKDRIAFKGEHEIPAVWDIAGGHIYLCDKCAHSGKFIRYKKKRIVEAMHSEVA